MPKSPSPKELFHFGLEVAWHVCGCETNRNWIERIAKSHCIVRDVARGDLTLQDSPMDLRNQMPPLIEQLRQQDDEVAKKLIEDIEKVFETEYDENCCRRRIAEDRNLAKCVLKSF